MGDAFLETTSDRSAWIEKVWLGFVFLFGLSLLTSKSGLTLMGPLLILWSFFDRQQIKMWSKYKLIVGLMTLFPLALICSSLSLSGSTAVIKVLTMWHWPLIAAPTICIYQSLKGRWYFLYGLVSGLILATFKALFSALKNYYEGNAIEFLSDNYRIASFWDIGRWGFFIGLVVLVLFLVLQENRFKKFVKPLRILFLLSFISLILSNSRAPYIALIVVLILLSATNLKLFKRTLLLFCVTFSLLLLNHSLFERIASIFSVSIDSNRITSSHKSNASRLYMWKVSLDFFREQPWFGTGFESTSIPLSKFLSKQTPEYIENVNKTEFSHNDQHSSYMNSLVQMGVVFTLICWSFIFFIFLKSFYCFYKNQDYLLQYFTAGFLYSLIIFIFYSSFFSYESVIFFMLLAITAVRSSQPKTKST